MPGGVQDLAWSPDGQSLAAACTDGTVRIWAISEGSGAESPVLSAHKEAVLSVAWSPDGSRLASGGKDGTVCIWQPSAAFGPMITHDKGAPLHSLAVSDDGTQIAAGSQHGDIFTWKGGNNTNATSGTPKGAFSASRGSPAGETRFRQPSRVKSTSGTVRHAILSGLLKPAESKRDNQTVWRVRWSLDGKKLASSSHTGAGVRFGNRTAMLRRGLSARCRISRWGWHGVPMVLHPRRARLAARFGSGKPRAEGSRS